MKVDGDSNGRGRLLMAKAAVGGRRKVAIAGNCLKCCSLLAMGEEDRGSNDDVKAVAASWASMVTLDIG